MKRDYAEEMLGSSETITVYPAHVKVEIDFEEARCVWELMERRFVFEELAKRLEESSAEDGCYGRYLPIRRDIDEGRIDLEKLASDLFDWHWSRDVFDKAFDQEVFNIWEGFFTWVPEECVAKTPWKGDWKDAEDPLGNRPVYIFGLEESDISGKKDGFVRIPSEKAWTVRDFLKLCGYNLDPAKACFERCAGESPRETWEKMREEESRERYRNIDAR